MSLPDLLVSQKPREQSGSTSANRFDYQLDWALCHLLELHEQEQDYVVVLDYHDDVLVLDSATEPKSVICYQIKTKTTGNWTPGSLTKREKAKDGSLLPSKLGKLYRHHLDFGEGVKGLLFVSNASFSAKMPDDTKCTGLDEVSFDGLCQTHGDQLSSSLVEECEVPEADLKLSLLGYQRSQLAPSGHADQALGRLATFLEGIVEAGSVPAPAFYRTLKGEMSRALHFEGRPSSFSKLCTLKSLTREKFKSILSQACAQPRRAEYAEIICTRLDIESVPYQEVMSMRSFIRKFSIERLDATDTSLQDCIEIVEREISESKGKDSLWEEIESVRLTLDASNRDLGARFGTSYLRAIIGVLIHELGQISHVDSESQEGQA